MSTENYTTEPSRAENRCLFAHRIVNPDFFADPADPMALVDNLSEILDHACGMAKTLYAGVTLVDAELDPQDLKHASWALAHQIQDAQALLDAWHQARTMGGAGHDR